MYREINCPESLMVGGTPVQKSIRLRLWRISKMPESHVSSFELSTRYGLTNDEVNYVRECAEIDEQDIAIKFIYPTGESRWTYDIHWVADLFPPYRLDETGLAAYYREEVA